MNTKYSYSYRLSWPTNERTCSIILVNNPIVVNATRTTPERNDSREIWVLGRVRRGTRLPRPPKSCRTVRQTPPGRHRVCPSVCVFVCARATSPQRASRGYVRGHTCHSPHHSVSTRLFYVPTRYKFFLNLNFKEIIMFFEESNLYA